MMTNLSDYKILRQYVSHDSFRNDFLHRLDAPAEFFSSQDNVVREQALTAAIEAITTDNLNLPDVIATWKGNGAQKEDLPSLILKLYGLAKTLSGLRLTKNFPSQKKVESWIEVIGKYVNKVGELSCLSQEDRHQLALETSRALRELSDFLHGLDVHSKCFWRYFERID